MPVADTSQVISGVAERYATSLFELALEAGSLDAVGADLNRFQAMIDSSDDLKRLVASPVFSAEDQTKAIVAICEKAGLGGLVANFLKGCCRQSPSLRRFGHDRRLPADRRSSSWRNHG